MDLSKNNTVYAVDAHGFLHRAYHAMPKLSTSAGVEVGALYGFAKTLLKIMRDKKPRYMAVCFDSPGKNFRHALYGEYKAHRKKTEDELVAQLRLARELVSGMGIKMLAFEGYEADDILAAVAKKSSAAGLSCVLVTSDKDSYQLINDRVSVWPGGSEPPRGAEYVRNKYGISPSQLADYFAIVGDASDNIPGIAGLGPVNAAKLITRFGTLSEILEQAKNGNADIPASAAKKIVAGVESALLSRKLVEPNTNIDLPAIEEFSVSEPDSAKTLELFRKYEFRDMLVSFAPKGAASPLPAASAWKDVVARIGKEKKLLLQLAGDCMVIGFEDGMFASVPLAAVGGDMEILKKAVLDDSIVKVSHDFKKTFMALDIIVEKGRILRCFDTVIAAYCLNPSRANFDFTALAAQYLDVVAPSSASEPSLYPLYIWKLCSKLSEEMEKAGVRSLFDDIEIPLVSILGRMEKCGIALDSEALVKVGEELHSKSLVLQREIEEQAGMPVNLNSPKQLADMLFVKMGIKPLRKNKTGYSTDEEVLREIAAEHPIADKIIEYREAAKLKSTYVDSLLELAKSGGGRLHTLFDQTGTATGRLSSSKPNLQNIPVKNPSGKAVRRCFIPAPGKVLMSADYSQIDLRVLAHESADPALVAAFKADEDIHSRTACEVFHVEPLFLTPEMRRAAKAINFGIVYGQTAMGLSAELSIPRREAQDYIDHYFTTYSGVKTWIDSTIASVREKGFVSTLSGRRRYFPELKSGNGALVSFAQRAAVNTVIQGGSADIIKMAMIKLHPLLANENAELLLQIHDELVFELDPADIKRVAALVRSVMQDAAELRVPLKADVKWGKNLNDMQKLEA